jgi:NADPH:quinone reductase-like Zn-dependent oxidoreductase
MIALTVSDQATGVAAVELDEPRPSPDEALVAVEAVSLNRGEVRLLAERPHGAQAGWDLAGTVLAAAADGSGPPVGARVVGLSREQRAWAQRVAVPTTMLATLPDRVSTVTASTLPVAGLTALIALELGGPLLERRLLVTGASGGVGRFAVQLAARAGARVTAVSAGPERAAGLLELGAETILHAFEPAGEELDVVLDGVGGASLSAALQRIAPDGTVVSYSGSDPTPVSFSTRNFYLRAPGAALRGLSVFHAVGRRGGATRPLEALLALTARGELHPQIGLEADWRDPAPAIRALVERRVVGKAVLHVA